MRILIVGEGKHENAALGELVRRIAGDGHQFAFRPIQSCPVRWQGQGGGTFKRAVAWMVAAGEDRYDAVVVLVDEDGDAERVRQMNQAQAHTTKSRLPRAVGVAIRTFDAWMLADEVALSQALRKTVPTQRAPENNPKPKEACERLRDAHAPNLGLAEMYASVAARVRVDVVAKRCPRGFAPFAKRVRECCGGL